MAQLCDLSYQSLATADSNFLRLSTLRAANNRLINKIAKLPIFKEWQLHPDLLHGSLDGIKLATERETLLARHSPKYFGLDKGVTGYFMIVNHVPVNTVIHGSNEHESHFLFDLVYNNESDVQPDILSTDTEGSNQLNFFLLYLIEKYYAPRYRSLTKKMGSIVSYSNREKFADYLIKPEKRLDEKLILAEEENVKHILASLLLGEVNQSHMIAKLSSNKVTNRTKRALWEINAILMTEHLLTCVDDVNFRQAVQAALNRGEAYNQLRRHIAKVNGRDFLGNNQEQIAVSNECARLLSNSVIYYNALILNGSMEKAKKKAIKNCWTKLDGFRLLLGLIFTFKGNLSLVPYLINLDYIEALLALLESIELE